MVARIAVAPIPSCLEEDPSISFLFVIGVSMRRGAIKLVGLSIVLVDQGQQFDILLYINIIHGSDSVHVNYAV